MGEPTVSGRVESMIKVEGLMTKDIRYHSGNVQEDSKFCIERDISSLPDKDNIHYWEFNKNSRKFIKKRIVEEDIINPEADIKSFIEKTKDRDLLFVMKNNKLVGIIHFCDIINSDAYVYFYALFHEFENEIRKILIKNKKTNDNFLSWLSKKENGDIKDKLISYKIRLNNFILPSFQHFELRDLIKFVQDNDLIPEFSSLNKKEIHNIINVRNLIMHHKDIASRQKHEKIANNLLYHRGDYNNFLMAYYLILRTLRRQ